MTGYQDKFKPSSAVCVRMCVTPNVGHDLRTGHAVRTWNSHLSQTDYFPHNHWSADTSGGRTESNTHVIVTQSSHVTNLGFHIWSRTSWPKKMYTDHCLKYLINLVIVLICNWVCRTMSKAQTQRRWAIFTTPIMCCTVIQQFAISKKLNYM